MQNRVADSSALWPDSDGFWRDKRVIVTGGAGFLGSFVVEKLAARKAAEVIIPRKATRKKRMHPTGWPRRCC